MTQQLKPQIALTSVDNPEIRETFCDMIDHMSVYGPTVRMDFSVVRMQPVTGGQAASGEKHPVCRLVMPVAELPDLVGKLQALVAILEQQGVLRKMPPVGPLPVPNRRLN